MGSHSVLTLLYLKNVLYWPEDVRLRSKLVAIMRPDCIYYITVLIYFCVLTVYNTLYKSVTTQQDDLCQINLLKIGNVEVHFYPMLPDIPNSTALFEVCQTLPACSSGESNIYMYIYMKMSTEH